MLGQELRARYVTTGFLSSTFNATEVRIFSSEASRTKASAQAQAMGMWPQTAIASQSVALPFTVASFTQQIYSPTVPVTVLPDSNHMLRGYDPTICPKINAARDKFHDKNATYKTLIKHYLDSGKGLYKNMTAKYGINVTNYVVAADIFDELSAASFAQKYTLGSDEQTWLNEFREGKVFVRKFGSKKAS